jgi:short-subunit dehydrogenase
MQLTGKVVIITGASQGIGAACAAALRKRGARLVLNSRYIAPCDDHTVPGDITHPEIRRRLIEETTARFGRIDVLINNAGVAMYAPAWRAPDADVRAMIELNIYAPLDLIRLAVPHMQRQGGGMIVNISSIAGMVPLPWFTLYSASKHFVRAMTEALRIELRRDRIHCMTVCPGYVTTNFRENSLASTPPEKMWRMPRFVISAEQCADAIVRGIERDALRVVTPRTGHLLAAARLLFPRTVDYLLGRIYDKL